MSITSRCKVEGKKSFKFDGLVEIRSAFVNVIPAQAGNQ